MQATYQLKELITGQTTNFRRACSRRESGVSGIDIDSNVHGPLHALMNFLENFRYTFIHHFVDRDRPRAKFFCVSVILLAAQWTTNANLYILAFADQSFL